jgi:hypothetical protein
LTGHDGGVDVCLELDARWDGDVRDVQGATDGERANVDVHRRRNICRPGLHAEGEQLLVDDAVAVVHLDGLTHQVDADLGRNDLVAPDDEEVDVGDHVLDRVVLDVTRQGEEVVPADREREQGVAAGLAGHRDLELAGLDRHRDRFGTMPVDDPGDPPFTAEATGRARSGLASGFGGERDFGHAGTPRKMRRRGSRRLDARWARTRAAAADGPPC